MGETYLGKCTDNFSLRRFLRATLGRFLRALGLWRKFPNPGDGETGGAAKDDAGCVRNPPILICIQVLRRAGAIAKRRGALRCHTL